VKVTVVPPRLGGFTVIVLVAELDPEAFVTVSLAVYVLGLVYVNVGDGAVESTMPSFWKSHARDSTVPVDVSVNCTVRGATPLVGAAVKLAVGGGSAPSGSKLCM
jgi:hypothetical protein